MLDCRLFLLGDRYRQLMRAYHEAIYRLKRDPDSKSADSVLGSAEIGQYYDVSVSGGGTKLTLREAQFREQYPLCSADFALRISAGSRLTTMPLPMERFHALDTLLPLLAGDHSEMDLQATIERALESDGQKWTRDLLATLDILRCLERGRARPNHFLDSPVRPRVTLVGHTSILLQSRGATILTDPLLRWILRSPASAFDVTRLDLDAICCTHAHWDHCDVETLLRFKKDTPIIIPRVEHPTAFNPPIAPVLRRLGFQDIRELDPWSRVQLGDVEMILVPFYGEQDEPGAEIAHYTYVYRTQNLTLYGGVDAYRDTTGDMHDVLLKVREEYHPSVAFLPISRMVYRYDQGGVSGFCRYIDTAILDKDFQYTAGPDEAAEWVQLLGVSTVVPYATFKFSPRSASKQTNEFYSALNKRGLGHTLLPLRPLDALDAADFDGSTRASQRRWRLRSWFQLSARVSAMDQRLQVFALYRFARRLMMRGRSSDPHHRH
jgi:L-ascorbate metabolism protein UlaG (beta-lactamase superfamily)